MNAVFCGLSLLLCLLVVGHGFRVERRVLDGLLRIEKSSAYLDYAGAERHKTIAVCLYADLFTAEVWEGFEPCAAP